MHNNYNEFGQPNMSPDPHSDNPDLTEIRATRKSDVATMEAIEAKCHETPMERADIADLVGTEGIHGILGIRSFQNVGFALFNVQDNGATVFVNRFSVAYMFMDRGVPEKMVETLRTTLDGGPPARLRMLVSEHCIGEPMFDKLLGLGFVSNGIAPLSCVDYSRVYGRDVVCDGIKLELG